MPALLGMHLLFDCLGLRNAERLSLQGVDHAICLTATAGSGSGEGAGAGAGPSWGGGGGGAGVFGAGDAAAEVLLDLERERFLFAVDREVDREGLIDGRDGVFGELDVDDGADDLDDFTGVAHR